MKCMWSLLGTFLSHLEKLSFVCVFMHLCITFWKRVFNFYFHESQQNHIWFTKVSVANVFLCSMLFWKQRKEYVIIINEVGIWLYSIKCKTNKGNRKPTLETVFKPLSRKSLDMEPKHIGLISMVYYWILDKSLIF